MEKELSFEDKMFQKGIQTLSIEEIEKYKAELEAKRNRISFYTAGDVIANSVATVAGLGVAGAGLLYDCPIAIGAGAFITASFTGLFVLMCKEDSKNLKVYNRLKDHINLLQEAKNSKSR